MNTKRSFPAPIFGDEEKTPVRHVDWFDAREDLPSIGGPVRHERRQDAQRFLQALSIATHETGAGVVGGLLLDHAPNLTHQEAFRHRLWALQIKFGFVLRGSVDDVRNAAECRYVMSLDDDNGTPVSLRRGMPRRTR